MPEKCTNESCPNLDRLEKEVRLFREQNSETHKEIFKRLNELEQGEAAQSVQYTNIMGKLDNLTQKLEALEAKPAKQWETLVEKAVWAIAAAVIAFLLRGVGL